MTPSELVDVGDEQTSFLVDPSVGGGVLVHWGAPLGAAARPAQTAAALRLPAVSGGLDVVAPAAFVPEHGSGYSGRPGLSGRRPDGRAWSPRFTCAAASATADQLVIESRDDTARLLLLTTVRRHDGGAMSIAVELVNESDEDYWLDDLAVTLALPAHVGELMTFHGRWCRELHPRRQPFDDGPVLAENRRGRTSHENPPLLWAGTTGFGEQQGEVWGVHLAWSGNARVSAARLADGRAVLQLGELLHPGEIVLRPGERYASPAVYAVHSTSGLGAASRRFHAVVRASPAHPSRPRPVVLNTWEAVYFDHDLATLTRLAESAAAVGVERFVLDDGWFGGRRDDRRGLGDWFVSPAAHPGGLRPLIDTVGSLGMDFGIWVEPEMVNPDSELYRAHPDWVLATPGYELTLGRHQLVLDLAIPGAFAEILGRLDVLLGDHDIAFVKWDMNRDHVQGSGADGRAGSHAQTLAVYRLFDELRRRHPDVEWESCASGGGRVDLGILQRAARVWASDCNDPLERQVIHRHATMLIPPEVIGAHVGAPTSHTTGRTQTLAFRAGTALFGHFGIEWNLLATDADALDELSWWVELYKRHRHLLHGGDVVRVDHPDPHAYVHGVLAADRSCALLAYAQLSSAAALLPRPVRVPELDPERSYRVELVAQPRPGFGRLLVDGPVGVTDGLVLTGRQLAAHGVRLPVVTPDSVELLWIDGS